MTENEVLQDFRDAGALLEGHFVLTSGLHSPKYLQCARVMMDAQRAGRLCRALRDKVSERIGPKSPWWRRPPWVALSSVMKWAANSVFPAGVA